MTLNLSPCSRCPRKRGIVPPYFPETADSPHARVLFIAEAPSYEEDKRHIPLVGKTGFEFTTTYLPIIGIPRSECAITNAFLCSHYNYSNPTPEDALACSGRHLSSILEIVQPEIIVPMGAVACSLWPEIDLQLQHGMPVKGRWGSWEGYLWPTFHPSAGLHATAFMIPLTTDFDNLRKFMLALDRNEFTWPSDPYPEPDYRVCRSRPDIREYIEVYGDAYTPPIVGEDTESLPPAAPHRPGDAYCLTFSLAPGSARLIYRRDTHLIEEYGQWLREKYPLQIFHNYLHDANPYEQMGLPSEPFYDTMVRAYNLCLGGGGDEEEESRAGRGSLGLKVLAYRHLNMRMTSFKDTVWPHSKPYVLRWLWQGEKLFRKDEWIPRCATCGHSQDEHAIRGKANRHIGSCTAISSGPHIGIFACQCTRYKSLKKPKTTAEEKFLSGIHLKLTNIILDLESGKPTDPWKRIKEWDDEDLSTVTEVLGHMPQPSIAHVPETELTYYACRDADADRRLYFHMEHMKPWLFYD